MRAYVKALRNLYKRGSTFVTLTFLQKQLSDGKITQEEYDYIISDSEERCKYEEL